MGEAAGPRGPLAWAVSGGLVLITAALWAAAAGGVVRLPAAHSVQLRVIGASNRPAAQALKLQVRDAVLAVVAPAEARAATARDAMAALRTRLPAVRAAAAAVAGRAGVPVAVRLGPEPFPARHIGFVRFPAGSGDALVVTLGRGRGHNWWTVLFPPLAMVTVNGRLAVVGPAGAAVPVRDLTARQRRRLLNWVAGRTTAHIHVSVGPAGPDGSTGLQVQVRFALWQLWRSVAWRHWRRALAWT